MRRRQEQENEVPILWRFGLPRLGAGRNQHFSQIEHTTGLCKSYEDKQTVLQEKLRESSLRLSRLESVSWRVDYTLSSSELREVNEPTVLLRFQVNGPDPASKEPIVASLTAEKFRVLLTELKQAQVMMNALN
ncbi:COMM domain-containing protein 4-like [Acipenser oxyrinchus oxyrinchus]|uniref:COMM domain-containing protein 4-like n=1 Tax=Acipenser oxyrinchus oxyrinchus TaxID=40147 RepID=A0AAD8D1P1_ACIOX|nr:COMM domain-containing protein 4-like [Acipenser oxyrinchus oxyrinchus]